MRKIISTILLILPLFIKSQNLYFTLEDYNTCVWNDVKGDYYKCESYWESSLLTLNEDETVFKHITTESKLVYYVRRSEYNSEYEIYKYEVSDENGKSYIFLIDLNNELFKILGESNQLKSSNNEQGIYLTTYKIKKYWE